LIRVPRYSDNIIVDNQIIKTFQDAFLLLASSGAMFLGNKDEKEECIKLKYMPCGISVDSCDFTVHIVTLCHRIWVYESV